jgi:hypothetical protein
MSKYVVEFLTTNRYGGLVDKSVVVLARDERHATLIVQTKHPRAAIGYVEQVQK